MTKKVKISVSIIVVLIVLIGGLLAWHFLGSAKSPADSSVDSPAPSPVILSACTKAGGDDDLCSFYAGIQDFTKMSSQMVITSGGETMKIYYDGKGNSHVKSAEGMQIIVLNESSYYLEAGATEWIKLPDTEDVQRPTGLDMSALEERFKSENGENTTQLTYAKLGKKELSGQDVVGYKVYNDASRAAGTEFWFNKKDNRIYQMIYTDANNENTTDVTITYDKVEIPTPSPVRKSDLR